MLMLTRVYRLVVSRAVVWWGLPTAIVWSVAMQFQQYGFAWRTLWSTTFLIRLAVAVPIIGLGGGALFGAAMRRVGLDPTNGRPE
jgi:hypothetical protein